MSWSHFACFQQSDVALLSDLTKVDKKELNQYIWDRRRHEITNHKIIKFVEAIWRSVFYHLFCILAIKALFFPEVASWVLNTEDNWNNWPLQPMNDAVILLYQIQLGSYMHQLMWTEVNRSDAAEMILHHLTTITVVVFSYLTGFTRIGSAIFLVHDLADIFLETAKCFTYIKKAKRAWAGYFADTLFAFFAITFFVTRLFIYPYYLVNSLLFEAPRIMGMWPGYYAFAGLLLTLQALHIFWCYLIAKMIVKLFTTGIEKDVRSDDEDEDIVVDSGNAKSDDVSTTSTTPTTTSATASTTSTASGTSATKRKTPSKAI